MMTTTRFDPCDPLHQSDFTVPVDGVHAMVRDAIAEQRAGFDALRRAVEAWQPAPCPPREVPS